MATRKLSEEQRERMATARRRAKSRGSKFVTELRRSFDYTNCFFMKLSDNPHFQGMQTRFDEKKPFDIVVLLPRHGQPGLPVAIEAKCYGDYKAFSTKQLLDNQIEGLEKWSKVGGLSYVFVNIRRSADKLTETRRVNRLYCFEYNWLKARGIIKKKELMELPYLEPMLLEAGLFGLKPRTPKGQIKKTGLFNVEQWISKRCREARSSSKFKRTRSSNNIRKFIPSERAG